MHGPLSNSRIGLRHLVRFPLTARIGFCGGRPLGTKFFRVADDTFDEIAGRLFLRGSIGSATVGRNFKQLELFKNRFHGAVRVTEKFSAANAREDPAHALDDFAFESGLSALLLFIERAHEAAGVLRVLNQLAAQVVGLEVIVGTEGVHNQHLVASATGGDVEALLEQFLIAKRERAALSGVHQRDEDDVALVALELSGVTAQEAMEFVAVGREMRPEEIINIDGLFVADQRNHAEAGGLSGIVFLVFGLLDVRDEEGGSGQSFLTIDLAVAGRARDAIGNGVRAEPNAAGVAQRLDAVIVGNQVAELDDFRDAAEMFDEASGAAEGLARKVVDGNLAIVKIGIGDSGEVLEDEVLDDAKILADGGRADLFVVADDEDGFSEVE